MFPFFPWKTLFKASLCAKWTHAEQLHRGGHGWLEVAWLKSGVRNAEPVRPAAGRRKRLRPAACGSGLMFTQTQPFQQRAREEKPDNHSIWLKKKS